MTVRFTCHLFLLCLLLTCMGARASGLDDADDRLFQVQQSLAKKGDARAQYYLGEMYEQGLGTTQNLDEAFKWYAKAADQGDFMAKRKMAHRAEIEADAKVEQAAEEIKPTLAPAKPDNSADTPQRVKKTKPATAQADKNTLALESAKAAQKAAEKEKRRAEVRAMILERIRHPVGEPFE